LLQLMPLAVWAKIEPRHASADAPPQENDLHDLIEGLAVPPNVAAISYAGGCRIRRVRVPAARTAPKKGARGARPVILSKRALDAVRSETRSGR